MLSAENLLELLQVLPDDKRKKLLLNSKLKKYSIDGYRTLKNVPIKVLSTYAAKSSLFCQIFLDLIIDEYNNLTTKDSQTFAVDEYPGILAYYFKYGMDIAPIKIRYEALTVPIKIEKESSQQEVEKVGNDMTMKKYFHLFCNIPFAFELSQDILKQFDVALRLAELESITTQVD